MLVNLFDGLNFIHAYEAFCGLHLTPCHSPGWSNLVGFVVAWKTHLWAVCEGISGKAQLRGGPPSRWGASSHQVQTLEGLRKSSWAYLSSLPACECSIGTSESSPVGVNVVSKTSDWVKRNLPGLQHMLELLGNIARWAEQLLDS